MKKKGFTLIELLGVIVILAIIMIIAIPKILKVIENVEIESFKSSAKLMADSARFVYFNNTTNNKNSSEFEVVFKNGEYISDNKLNFKGDNPDNGTIKVSNNGKVAMAIISKNKKYCATKDYYGSVQVKKVDGTCSVSGLSASEKDEEEFLYKDYNIADSVYFNPIDYKYCVKGTTNCIEWYVIDIDETNNILSLVYALDNDNIKWTENNIANVISNATSNWHSNLKITKKGIIYDGENVKYDFSNLKARALLSSDINDTILSKISTKSCTTSYPCVLIDENTKYFDYIQNNAVTDNFMPFSANTNVSVFFVHPVIEVEKEKIKTSDIITITNEKISEGDYISMQPTINSYEITTELTGYNQVQKINPSDLSLWRIIKIFDDGTFEAVSDKTSDEVIYFYGLEGYKKIVGSLNVIAKQYENSKYTLDSRYLGYNNQTEIITETELFDNYLNWTCSTLNVNPCTPIPDESIGGGDQLSREEQLKIYEIYGTTHAYNSKGVDTSYWLSGRIYMYHSSSNVSFYGQFVDSTRSSLSNSYSSCGGLYTYCQEEIKNLNYGYALRPVLKFKSGLKATGTGTNEDPYILN